MTTNTMVALKSYTVTGSAVSSIGLDLTGISGYTDLRIVANMQDSNSYGLVRFNSDTGNNYSRTWVYGDGSSALSNRTANASSAYYGSTTSGSEFLLNTFDIMNYSNSTTFKTTLVKQAQASSGGIIGAFCYLWFKSTKEPITRVDFISATGGATIAVGSSITVYGIANADIGAYATGGIITQDSTYYYHAFGSSGTFTPSRALTADILVVAGGGGGGNNSGGGGGAGGVLAFASQSLSSGTGYTCTVGAPGAGNTQSGGGGAAGSSGSNSQFASLTASVGGGGGATYGATTGLSGGSGGGGANSGSGGTNTSGQGNVGGAGSVLVSYASGGGGGGAGTAGTAGSGSTAGVGGDGLSTVTNWGSLASVLQATGYGNNGYIAAGGGGAGDNRGPSYGGAGGNGGGGAGSGSGNGANAVAYSGSGGGGAPYLAGSRTSGNGGSGLIIVRYAK